MGLLGLSNLCHIQEYYEKFLIYSSFSLEQLLSAVSETKVTTFRFAKKTVEQS